MKFNTLKRLPTSVKLLWTRMTIKLPDPDRVADIGVYRENFERAVRFTRTCGFDLHQVTWRSGDLLDKQGNCITSVLGSAGIDDASKSAGQCLKWSHYLAPHFEEALGCKVWPTVGQIWKDNNKVFSPSWRDLRRWADSGIQLQNFKGRQGMNLHSWLTLDTGEIIEPSFLSTLASVHPKEYGKLNGGLLWGRDPGVLNQHRYFPMAVGREYLERVSAKSICPLLATNLNELNSPIVAIVATPI